MDPLPRTSIADDIPLWVWRPRGMLTKADVSRMVGLIDAVEERSQRPFNRFTDLSEIDVVALDFRFVFGVSLHRRIACAGREPVKSAFLATNEEARQAVKIHVLMTDHSPLQCALFETLDEAADWLGVPVEKLTEAENEPPHSPTSFTS